MMSTCWYGNVSFHSSWSRCVGNFSQHPVGAKNLNCTYHPICILSRAETTVEKKKFYRSVFCVGCTCRNNNSLDLLVPLFMTSFPNWNIHAQRWKCRQNNCICLAKTAWQNLVIEVVVSVDIAIWQLSLARPLIFHRELLILQQGFVQKTKLPTE